MITLAFFNGAGAASQAIEWFSAGEVSHVAAVMADGNYLDARLDKEGASAGGVQMRPASGEGVTEAVRYTIETSAAEEAAFWDFLHAQIGKPYDVTGILAFVAGRDWHATDSWFCSELQAAALEAAGVVNPLYAAANKVTPAALALVCSAVGTRVARSA